MIDSHDRMSMRYASRCGYNTGTRVKIMTHRIVPALIASVVVLFASLDVSAFAQQTSSPTSAPTVAKNNYANGVNWLCRPDRKKGENDACNADISTTIVAPDGKTTIERWHGNPKAGIDCFYVYPTVSLDATPNSDMIAGAEELSVVKQQFARFGSQCRLFAPLYRQITLTALRDMIAGKPVAMNVALGYNDVLDAWNYYLQHDNHGRGVVLIGHSQGSSVLTQLIAKEIDGKPVQSKLVSALLLGWNVAVPNDKDVGGSFKSIPLCHAVNQTGCAIVYASFRATSPPPANSRFGKVPGENMQAACVNPAAIGGGPGELHSYLSAANRGSDANSWVAGGAPITTPFVSVPGLLSAECMHSDAGSYLAITINADPKDPRVDDISGDVISNGQVQKDWGLHLIDANLTMGNLIDIVAEQSKAYQHHCPCKPE